MIRYQPPFTLLADKEMALQVLRLDDTPAGAAALDARLSGKLEPADAGHLFL